MRLHATPVAFSLAAVLALGGCQRATNKPGGGKQKEGKNAASLPATSKPPTGERFSAKEKDKLNMMAIYYGYQWSPGWAKDGAKEFEEDAQAPALMALAQGAEMMGETDRALALYEQAAKARPTTQELYAILRLQAALKAQKGDFEGEAQTLAQLMGAVPDPGQKLFTLEQLMARQWQTGQHEAALKTYEEARQTLQQSGGEKKDAPGLSLPPGVSLYAAQAALALGKDDGAEAILGEYFAANPKPNPDDTLRPRLADMAMRLSVKKEDLKAAQKTLNALPPSRANASLVMKSRLYLAAALRDAGQTREALGSLKTLNTALLQPQEAQAVDFAVLDLALATNDEATAATRAQRLLAAQKGDPHRLGQLHLYLGEQFLARKQKDKARQHFSAAAATTGGDVASTARARLQGLK